MDQLSTELQRQLHIHDKNQRGSEKKTVRPVNSLYLRNLCSFALDDKYHDFPVVAYVFLCLLITQVSRV